MKKNLGKILLDLIPVAIGVYIGIFVSNWNEEKQKKALTADMLDRIEREINLNQKRISDVQNYHIMVRDTVQKINIDAYESHAAVFRFWRGFQMPRLHSSAFETAYQSGVTPYIDADLLERLNTLYTQQESYNDFSRTAGQGLYNIDFSSDDVTRRMLVFVSMIMSDIFFFEQGLEAQFKSTLEAINNSK